ncbi:hypothetical protein ACFIOY_28795 [Bradyrhizobium sp. TZ2]
MTESEAMEASVVKIDDREHLLIIAATLAMSGTALCIIFFAL